MTQVAPSESGQRDHGNIDGAAAPIDPRRLSHGCSPGWRARAAPEAGVRLSAPQPRENCRGRQLSGRDSLHRSAGLSLLHDQQLGICAGGREAGGAGGAGARRVYPGDRGGADQAAESCRHGGISAAGYGRQRHAADVCLPRAGEGSGPVRSAKRRAHDVQLHALRRSARGLLRGMAWPDSEAGGGV